jgi:hypothetical protein
MLRKCLYITPYKCIVYSWRLENIPIDYNIAVFRIIAPTAYLTDSWNIVLISINYET